MKTSLRVLMAAALVIGCGRAENATDSARADSTADSSQAVTVKHTEPDQEVVDLLAALYPDALPAVVAEAAGVAGLHDAQALTRTTAAGNDYGPEVRLYTGPRARRMNELQSVDGALVAIMQVRGDASGLAAYRTLKIDRAGGLYCVYLRYSIDWNAAIVPATGTTCATASGQFVLDVKRRTPSSSAANYAPVVRFGDYGSDTPSIGVPCGTGWCEIGDGLPANEHNPVHPGSGTQERIKGWHDEQRIAETDANGRPVRRATRGSITPVAGLATKPSADYATQTGTKVATIFLAGAPPNGPRYQAWGLQNGVTSVWIRNSGGRYEAQFTPGNSPADPNGTWFDAGRRDHPGVTIPGVARWMWYEDDEGAWVACDQGCCEISQNITKGRGGPPGPPPGPPPGTKQP